MRNLDIILDVDDVLMICTEVGLKWANRKFGTEYKISDITEWSFTNIEKEVPGFTKAIIEHMHSKEFLANQPAMEGSREFIKALKERGHHVMIFSAISPVGMGERAKRIIDLYNGIIDYKDINLGGNKIYMQGDVLLDDNINNISQSKCKYPVLFRQPWNQSENRFLSVRNYEEALALIDKIADAPEPTSTSATKAGSPGFVALVGPSCSGKTTLIYELLKDPRFEMARAVTTRERRMYEGDSEYEFVSKEDFETMLGNGEMIEYTVYAGNCYGLRKGEVENIWNKGKTAIRAMDMHGANAVKSFLGKKAVLVFIKRDKSAIIESLLERVRQGNSEGVVSRILNLDQETRNESYCDWVIDNNQEPELVAKQLLQIL